MSRTTTKIKSAMVRARIEPGLKTKAEKYFDMLGLSTTQAITLFFKQVELHHGLPFEINIPNAETLDAMKEIENGGGKKFKNADELFKHLGGCPRIAAAPGKHNLKRGKEMQKTNKKSSQKVNKKVDKYLK